MSAREAILNAIKTGLGAPQPLPSYQMPPATFDCVAHFTAKAKANIAQVTDIGAAEKAPEAGWAILAETKSAPRLHLPSSSPLRALPWNRAPGIILSGAPPSGDDSAFSQADWAIAETGTLVFLSGANKPSSWHFRPGREIVLVMRAAILARFEDVMRLAAKPGAMPSTINLVTGPSRTADIEQTIEYGAHGPRHLHILIAG